MKPSAQTEPHRTVRPGELSIVILTKDGGALWTEVLAALGRCDGFADAEVLVIDSGSRDGTLEHTRSHPGLRIHSIAPGEFGHGKTRNLAVRLTDPRRPIIVFLVQDATPRGPELLRELTAPLSDPRVAGVYGRQIAYGWAHPVEHFFIGSQYPAESAVREWSGAGKLRLGDMFFSNVCSAVRRSVLQALPFDESLVMSEDQRWSKSALLAGHKIVYQASAVVSHSHSYPLTRLFRRNFDSGASLSEIAADSFSDLVRYELRHLSSGLRSLSTGGEARFIPYFFAYEAVRAAGFAAGRRARDLPAPLCRALSLHAYHWQRETAG